MDDTYKVTLQTCKEARAVGSGFLIDGVVRTTDGYSSVKVYEWQYGQFVISYAPSTWLHSSKMTSERP